MIVYQALKSQFLDDVLSNNIDKIILKSFQQKLNRSTGQSEMRSWRESLQYVDRILRDSYIPENCGITIEYQIPCSSKRIDVIITGQNESNVDCAILIELKQWQEIDITNKDGIVATFINGAIREVAHPSYQVWSYAALLEGFNQTVYEQNIKLQPCAYLHNYEKDDKIFHANYKDYIDKAPIFVKEDAKKLSEFIKKYVKYGDTTDIMYRIDSGKIKPSKTLADSIVSLLKGNKEFLMIDDQKVVFENALAFCKKSSNRNKTVLIVEGGPGTGKSVVAINLLVEITKLGLLAQYVSKNAAPRAVYENRLTGSMRPTVIRNLFKGSGAYINTEINSFDALIVDEAHRLNEKSGLYGVDGENQIKEIIKASKFTIFFVDEDQRVTLKDIGEKEEIRNWAKFLGADVYEMELTSQFRCNGSDGYLSWLDNTLQLRETANESLSDLNFDFKVFNNPNDLRELIYDKNKINNKARMVAGYCWNWITKKQPNAFDVTIPEYNFHMKWNLTQDGSLWIVSPNSVNEIGCIHTCQGLEVDYIGVIIGNDFVIRNGKALTRPQMRATTDASIKGYKKLYEKEPVNGPLFIDKIIKNTYKILMTRGMKGCYVYFTDKETEEYFLKKSE